jgi:hypothetical protein
MRSPHYGETAGTKRKSDSAPSDFEVLIPRLALLVIALALLLVALTWLLHLETALPDVRAPRSNDASEVLRGHGLMSPGYHNISTVDAAVEGEWLLQEVGDADWLTTDQAGGNIQAAFYGTELYLMARVGPDAGRAYVTINNRPSILLHEDELGSFTDLWATQAADRPIRLATGLAHGEHLVEITAAGDGEVAISGFDVVAQTPFPWAFVLGYAGLTAGIFLVVRRMLYTLSSQPVPESQPRQPDLTGNGL